MAEPVVMVTGASSGIGHTIASDLLRHGYRIIAGMRGVDGKNKAIADELRDPGGRCAVVELDVTKDESVAAGAAEAIGQAGRLDVLINCAGIMWLGVTEAFTIAQFDAVLQTNLYGPFRLLKAVLPQMRAQGSGLVISISSIAGRLVTPGSGLYSASKFGLEAMTEAMRYETAPLGIDCVIVEPGPFRTNLKTNAVAPAENTVAEGYGPLNALQKLMPQRMAANLEAPGVTTDPQAVADCIRGLIALPPGKRPIRTTVGLDLGVDAYNRTTAAFQHAYLTALGMESCEDVRP